MLVAIGHIKLHLGSFASANPVALGLLERVGPVDGVQSVKQTLCIGADTKAPLLHLLLHHGMAATHANAVNHLIVGQYCPQCRTPVHHRLAQIGNAVVHQHFLFPDLAHGFPLIGCEGNFLRASHVKPLGAFFLKALHKLLNGLGTLALVTIERKIHPAERPLRPMVVSRFTCTHFTAPVKREADLVKLLTIAGNVLLCRFGRMLSCLYGVLLSRKSIGVIAHGIEDIVSA